MSDKQAHGPILRQNKPKPNIDTNKQSDVDAEDEEPVVCEDECSVVQGDDVAGRIKPVTR